MLFKIDENLPPEVAKVLKAAGHDACTIPDQKLCGKPDEMVASVAQAENRAIITMDLDFADIREHPPGEYPGLIVLRLQPQDMGSILEAIGKVIYWLGHEELAGCLWVTDGKTLRIRHGRE